MSSQSKKHRRRWLYVFPVALAALAVGVSQGLAGDGLTATNKVSPIINADTCGVNNGASSIGQVRVNREGDTLGVNVSVKKAVPGDIYVYLYNGDNCGYIDYLGKFKANDGIGNRNFNHDVAGYKNFIVYTYDDHYENSLIVTG
jgi:hypothetical protein